MNEHRTITNTPCGRERSRGLVLLAFLLALALGGIALMAAADVWSLSRQRAREQELLFVGDQYRKAILRYYLGAPSGAGRALPASLEDLLEDTRYPVPVHHLRRLYPDPITGSAEWGVVRVGERIAGIYSLSEKEPVKQAGFAPGYQQFSGKTSYREWVFAPPIPRRGAVAAPPSPAASGVAPSRITPQAVRRTPS
jgi:type II secretory pathway pseudopilin PulG